MKTMTWILFLSLSLFHGMLIGQARAAGRPGEFDFYVLALSWSPDYCAAQNDSDPYQCRPGKKLGFVLHGLWPQYDDVGYPSDCAAVSLADDVAAQFPMLYPNPRLAAHEWKKHGTCSGLTPMQYLTLTQELKTAVAIPTAYRSPVQPLRVTTSELKQAFIAANPDLIASAMTVSCSGAGRFLKEIFVCFTRAGEPTSCSRELRNRASRSCGQPDFLIRNVR